MNVNSTMKRVGRAVEFLAWAVFFAGCLLALALRFWLLPDIERYRGAIVAAAASAIGQPLSVGRIEARWYGLHPRINLTDVRIQDGEGRDVLVLPSVHNVVSWRSLLRGDPKLRSLVIEGLRVQVRRDAEGTLYVAGGKLGGERGFRQWILSQNEIVLRNAEIEWHDEKRGAPPLVLSALDLRLRNDGQGHAFGLSAQPPQALASSLELRGVIDATGSGRLYAELGYTDLAAWRAWLDYPIEVRRGEGALRAWLTLEDGEPRAATADLAATDLVALFGAGLAPLELASVRGRLQASTQERAYQVSARRLALGVVNGPSISPVDFQASWTPGWDEAKGAFSAPLLELEPLAFLAAALPFPAEVRRLLADLAPRGRLAEASLEWRGPIEAPSALAARGKFSALAAAPTRDSPGFAGLSGSFDTTQSRGSVRLDARQAALELPKVFPNGAIALDSVSGQVDWERLGERGFTVRSSSLSLANAHFSGNVHGSYANPGRGRGSADLSAQFNRADARHLAKYLPHARFIGGQEARAWLARAVVQGKSRHVRVRLQGALDDFPFRDPVRGQFRVQVRVEDGVLDYVPGWPRIEGLGGELVFERDRMEIRGARGKVLGATLASVRAQIAQLDAQKPLLTVSGEAQGPAAEFLEFIQVSPVRGMVGARTDAMSASGLARLRLTLELPLAEPERARLAGELELLGNTLLVHPELPAIEGAAGQLSFTESRVEVKEVRGRLFGGAVSVSGGARSEGELQLVARGEADVGSARPFFDHPLGKYFSGGASYTASLKAGKAGTRFVLESSLRGMASALPPPFAKAAGEELRLRVDAVAAKGEAHDRVFAQLGGLARAELQRRREGDAMRVHRAVLAFNPPRGQTLRRAERAAFFVYGALPALDADRWLALLPASRSATPELAFDVTLGQLDLYGKRFHAVAASGSADASGWSAQGRAREFAGQASYAQAGTGRLLARLTHFHFPEDAPGGKERSAMPRDLPGIDFSAQRFSYKGRELGRVELAGQPAGIDWLVEKVAMANPDATLHGKGAWRGGVPQRIAFDFALRANDAGAFLNRIGYPDLVRGGKAQLQGHLAWSGEPALLHYPSLSGDVQLQAEKGRFLEVDPGLGKLVSLMSLQALPRRITLDFRDVFSKGFEFERISSFGRIERGVMAVKEFRMGGTSAQVEMSGDVDLAAETQNLLVRVVPSLGNTAATVIGLANPLLAIPAVIVQKILKDPLGHIFAFDYAVSGAWSEPKVEKLGVQASAVNEQ